MKKRIWRIFFIGVVAFLLLNVFSACSDKDIVVPKPEVVGNENGDCDHEYDVSEQVEATCTVRAHTIYVCSICGDVYTVYTGDLAEHTLTNRHRNGDCRNFGYTEQYCTACKKVIATIADNTPGEHSFRSVNRHVAGNCHTLGYTIVEECSICGEQKIRNDEMYGDHKYGKAVYTAATCVAYDYYTSVCTLCGDVKVEYGTDVKGHDLTETVVQGVDCKHLTTILRTCKNCDYTETADTAVYGPHSYLNTGDGSQHRCSVCQTVEDHTQVVRSLSDERHLASCSVCGYVYESLSGEHIYDAPVITESTCTTDGSVVQKCSVCKHTYSYILPARHTYEIADGEYVANTCTEDGYYVYTCKQCGEYSKVFSKSILGTGRWHLPLKIQYDDCNPFGMIAGEFGSIENISQQTSQTASELIIDKFDLLSRQFAAFMDNFEIPTNTTTLYRPEIGAEALSDYNQFYKSAKGLYDSSLVSIFKSVDDTFEQSAVVGVNYPYLMTFGSPASVDYQTIVTTLFGFSYNQKTNFIEHAKDLAVLYATYRNTDPSQRNKGLENGCFYTANGSFVFPIAIKSGEYVLLTYVIVDSDDRVSVWISDISAALRATNYNYNANTFTELFCKNMLFVTGPITTSEQVTSEPNVSSVGVVPALTIEGTGLPAAMPLGSYPQTRVTSPSLYYALNGKVSALPTAEKGGSWIVLYSDGAIPYAWYYDVTYEDKQYRGVYFTSYRPSSSDAAPLAENSYVDDNGYRTGVVYWFEFRDISWQKVCENDGKTTYISSLVIDAEAWKTGNQTSLMNFIKTTFLQTAFSDTEIINRAITQNSLSVLTDEKFATLTKSNFLKEVTDYACVVGVRCLYDGTGSFASWWLKAADEDADYYSVSSLGGRRNIAPGHNFICDEHTDINRRTAQTCKDFATYYKYCSVCGLLSDEYVEYEGDGLSLHTYSYIYTDTMHTYGCSVCGETLLQEAHVFTHQQNANGLSHLYKCSACAYAYSELHSYGTEPVCTVCSAEKINYEKYWDVSVNGDLSLIAYLSGSILTLRGQGYMKNYSSTVHPPYYNERTRISTVSASTASTLYSIGEYAFCDCTALTDVTIPKDVRTIGKYAFYNTPALSQLKYNALSCGNFGADNNVFGRSGNNMAVSIDKDVKNIPAYLFCPASNSRPSIASVTGGQGVLTIGAYAFYSVAGVSFGSLSTPAVQKIGKYAFYNAADLERFVLGDDLTYVGEYAFYNCKKADFLGDPACGYVGEYAFYGCKKLTALRLSGGTVVSPYSFAESGLRNVILSDTITTIKEYAFKDCSDLLAITLSSSLINIERFAFYNSGIAGEIVMEELETIGDYAFYDSEKLTSFTAPKVKTMGKYAFALCSGLQTFSAESLTYISEGAFAEGHNLSDLEFSFDLTQIQKEAFLNCYRLHHFLLPKKVASIGINAFSGCLTLVEIDNRSQLKLFCGTLEYGRISLYAKRIYDGESDVSALIESDDNWITMTVAETKYIVGYVGDLSELTIDSDCTVLSYALYASDTLEKVSIGAQTVERYAFASCSGLTTVVLKSTVATIDRSAFYGDRISVLTIEGSNLQAAFSSSYNNNYFNNTTVLSLFYGENDVTPAIMCSEQSGSTVSEAKLDVESCDCNSLGTILQNNGSTAGLTESSTAEMYGATVTLFNELGELLTEFLQDRENEDKYEDFYDKAKELFDGSNRTITKNLGYDLTDGVLLEINDTWCSDKQDNNLVQAKLNVEFCDCNGFGVVLRENGETTELSEHTSAEILGSTVVMFDDLAALFASFAGDKNNNNKYQAFYAKAKEIFDGSNRAITKNIGYTQTSGIVIGLNSAWCSEKTGAVFEEARISVESCECNVFGTLMRSEGDVASLVDGVAAEMSSETAALFDELGQLFAAFITDTAEYPDFYLKAKEIFDGSNRAITKNLGYTQTSGAVIGLNNELEFFAQNGGGNTYSEVALAARLFGFNDENTFAQYVMDVASALAENNSVASTGTVSDRLKYKGAVYTGSGSFVLPFAFRNHRSSDVVLVYVIIDDEGSAYIWFSDVNAAFRVANYNNVLGLSGSTVAQVETYGRCELFETSQNSQWMYSVESIGYDYAECVEVAARLFGFDNVNDFTAYAIKLATVYSHNAVGASTGSIADRLKYDGAIYTDSGSFVLPFAFKNERMEKAVLAYVIVDVSGNMYLWISDVDAAFEAANYENILQLENDEAAHLDVLGRCMLFETPHNNEWYYFAGEGEYTYNQLSSVITRLFGYSNVNTFMQYAQKMASTYSHNTANASIDTVSDRMKYKGAVYTDNGSFILPYAFKNELVEKAVLVYVIVDILGNIYVWIDDVDAAFEAANYNNVLHLTGIDVARVDVYGRCVLFEEERFPQVDDLTIIQEGTFEGTGISYVYNKGKTLILTGTGTIPAITDNVLMGAETVIIGEGITGIGNSAFAGFASLISVLIPEGVASIGSSAFSSCFALAGVTLPSTITSIGNYAFADCYELGRIEFNCENVTGITENNAIFRNCGRNTNGIELVFGEDCRFVPSYMFNPVYTLSSVSPKIIFVTILGESISIGNYAFRNLTSVQELSFSEGTTIGEGALSGMTSLRRLTIPSLTGRTIASMFGGSGSSLPSSLKTIAVLSGTTVPQNAFLNCEYVETIVLPEYIESIGASAFEGCLALEDIFAENETDPFISLTENVGARAFKNCASLQRLCLCATIDFSLGQSALEGCVKLEEVEFNHLASIGEGAFLYCNSLSTFLGQDNSFLIDQYEESQTGKYGIGIYTYSGLDEKVASLVAFAGSATTYVVPATLTLSESVIAVVEIKKEAFIHQNILKKVTIGANVKTIGQGAFSFCTALTEIEFAAGNALTGIGAEAFYSCTALTTISLPGTVETVGASAFSNCTALSSFVLPASVTSLGESAFNSCRKLISFTFAPGSQITTISDSMFYSCVMLAEITLPSGVTTIGKSAFEQCSSMTSIALTDYIVKINDRAFAHCKNLTSFALRAHANNTDQSLGDNVFTGCGKLAEISLPSTVFTLGAGVFNGCSGLRTLTIPFAAVSETSGDTTNSYPFGYLFGTSYYSNAVKTEQTYITTTIRNMKTVVTYKKEQYYLPPQLTTLTVIRGGLPYGTFMNCTSLTAVDLGGLGLTTFNERVFYGCSSLREIVLPPNLTTIGEEVFYGCSSYSSVLLPASVETIAKSAFYRTGLHARSENWESGVLYVKVRSGEDDFVYYAINSNISMAQRCVIRDNTKRIIAGALENTTFTEVYIPTSVQYIDAGILRGNKTITLLSVPFIGSSREATDNSYLAYFFGVERTVRMNYVEYQAKVESSNYGVESTEKITDDESGEDVYIVKYKKQTQNALFSSTENCIPKSFVSLVLVGSGAIPEDCCNGCNTLQSVNLKGEYTTISGKAFANCEVLASVTFCKQLTSIGTYAFENCTAIEEIIVPNSVTSIGMGAFAGCTALTVYSVPFIGRMLESVQTSETCLGYNFHPSDSTTSFSSGENGNYIPENLSAVLITGTKTSIPRGAFYGCNNIKTVVIMGIVTNVGQGAFQGCTSLASVYVLGAGAFSSGAVDGDNDEFIDALNKSGYRIDFETENAEATVRPIANFLENSNYSDPYSAFFREEPYLINGVRSTMDSPIAPVYTSSDEEVATFVYTYKFDANKNGVIDASEEVAVGSDDSGEIILLKGGTTTVTASFMLEGYIPVSISYTLTVWERE